MKERFAGIPAALRKQILIHLSAAILGIAMSMLILAFQGGPTLLLPGIIITVVFLTHAWILYERCTAGKYVVLVGVCEEIEYSALRKRTTAVRILCDGKNIKIIEAHHSLRSLQAGDPLEVYIADSAPVYDHGASYLITDILAIRKGRKTS